MLESTHALGSSINPQVVYIMIRGVLVLVFGGVIALGVQISEDLNCTGTYDGVGSRDELFDELLPRVVAPGESEQNVQIKRVFLRYLTRTPLFLSMVKCNGSDDPFIIPRLLQEDEDGDDDGGGGGAGGLGGGLAGGANPLDNTNVLNGVRRILANVFTGNLIGIIQESVGLRSPEGVTTVFTDVLSTLFGSSATAGVTGILGNITTTPGPLAMNSSTLPPGYEAYIMQHYAQQQLLLQQQGQVGGGVVGGLGQQLGGGLNNQQLGGAVPQQQQQQYIPTQSQYLQQQYLQVAPQRVPINNRPVRQRVTKPPQEADDYEDDD